jgi:signal transduction histidine kinase
MSDDFDLLNNFVHDLKTPLSSAKSYVELIDHSGDLNEEQKYFYSRALVGLDRIQQIIDELLDFARMEAHNRIDQTTCDLTSILEKVTGLLENAANDEHVTLSYEVSDEARYAYVDPRLISHVMANLISNGIKYNKASGQVAVTTQHKGGMVEVTVKDTGIGIPSDQQEKIFDRFYRVERNDRRRIEGTGLGLTIVQSIVERHGGEIVVESTPGEGSIFRFTLPMPDSSSADIDREAPDDIDDRHQERRESHEDSDSDIF